MNKLRFGHCAFLFISAAMFGVAPHSPVPYSTDLPYDSDLDLEVPDLDADVFTVEFNTQVAPFLARHCVECHSGNRPAGGLGLEFSDETAATGERLNWDKIAESVRSGQMPPGGKPRTEKQEKEFFLQWTDFQSQRKNQSLAPKLTYRRLNRVEYDNTIRDLLGVSIRPSQSFPADDTAEGFDTNAEVLSVSPLLIEKYLSAAETVVEEAYRNPNCWHALTRATFPDYIPYVMRGSPALRDHAIKGQRIEILDETVAARAIELDRAYFALRTFADRAFRRPIAHEEMDRLMRLLEIPLQRGESIDAGLKLAFTTILVSPHFLFRVELHSSAGSQEDLLKTDFELATRLSYFLWSSMPDEELFRLAASRQLNQPRHLLAQVRRMLRDPKSRALAENFAGQWLQTRSLVQVNHDPGIFPNFDSELSEAMRQETEQFFDHIVREDKPVLDLLVGQYTFVNNRLAQHYNLPVESGSHFRRVSLVGTGRAGVLTHASVLTVTSGPTRTSPVKRGKWVLENILGQPTPPPPPGADGLPDKSTGTATSLRFSLERHRSRTECSSCHARIDPLGFGLENFDAIGAWRTKEGEVPIDASGIFPDGRTFRGSDELRSILAENPSQFTRCLTEKLMTYALGRSLGPSDRATVDGIVRHAARNNYRFSSLVIALVRSGPFQNQGTPQQRSSP